MPESSANCVDKIDKNLAKSVRQGMMLETFAKCSSTGKAKTQSEFEDNLARMLVEDMQPLPNVNSSSGIS